MKTRNFTPQQIAEIVSETVLETEKDLKNLQRFVALVARLTVGVCQALESDPHAEIQHTQSRSMKTEALIWKCVVKLKEN